MANIITEYERSLPRLSGIVSSENLPISSTAIRELRFWKGKKETASSAYNRLKAYWDNVGWPSSRWSPSGTPWSAAFISFLLGGQGFPGSAAHYKYVQSAMKGKTDWRAISIPKNKGKIQVAVGDVFVKPRSGGKTNSHGDVVYKIKNGKAYLAGGNLGNSAKTIKLPVTQGNILKDGGRYLIVLKKKPKKGPTSGTNKILAYGGFAVALALTGLLGFKVAKRKGLIGKGSKAEKAFLNQLGNPIKVKVGSGTGQGINSQGNQQHFEELRLSMQGPSSTTEWNMTQLQAQTLHQLMSEQLSGDQDWKPSHDPEIRRVMQRGIRETSDRSLIYLYKTRETHSNGLPVYRPLGEPEKKGMYGLTGKYYVWDGVNMLICGKPYKDEYGTFDGEPEYPLNQPFKIV